METKTKKQKKADLEAAAREEQQAKINKVVDRVNSQDYLNRLKGFTEQIPKEVIDALSGIEKQGDDPKTVVRIQDLAEKLAEVARFAEHPTATYMNLHLHIRKADQTPKESQLRHKCFICQETVAEIGMVVFTEPGGMAVMICDGCHDIGLRFNTLKKV